MPEEKPHGYITPEEMRELERNADGRGVLAWLLMENSGAGVAR